MKTDIRSLNKEELKEYMTGLGEKAFRAGQIYDWMHKRLVSDFDEMTNLSKQLRERLKAECTLRPLVKQEHLISKLDDTQKFLFLLEDGNIIESVLMKYKHGNSVCISSQVGCKMGCAFCASTLDGCVRSLEPAEMLGQIYEIQRISGERVSNIVVMGSGEPFDNYDNLLKFIELISDENGLNISQRNITVSTCGIVPKIYELSERQLQITLAISLHATTDEKRQKLMPVAKVYSIEELIKACRVYYEKTKRRLTFEYSLVAGVNDTKEDARQLAKLLGGINAHVNLIPVNPVTERGFKQPDKSACIAFNQRLDELGINATIRREMGRDIDGACGQLRRRHLNGS